MRTLGIGVLLVVVSSSSAAVQAVSTASIGGTLHDSSGAVPPGAGYGTMALLRSIDVSPPTMSVGA